MIYGYLRVSTIDQAAREKTSLSEQEKRIRGCVAMRMDEPELKIFSDPGVSGSIPLNERPAGIEMLSKLKPGDCIIASKLDRLFRSATDALKSVEDFSKQGVDIVLLDISADPIANSGVGKMFFTIMASVAEFERWRIAERMNDGRQAKLAKGGFAGGHAPYGMRAVGKGSHALLVEHDGEQKIVQLVTSLRFDSGRSLNQIVKELDRRGIQNREGKNWLPEQVRRIAIRNAQKEAAE